MNDILIILIIISVSLIVGLVIVWRQQIKLVMEAEWLNKEHIRNKTRKNIDRQLYQSDVIEIDPKNVHRITGDNLHTVLNNYTRRMGINKEISCEV